MSQSWVYSTCNGYRDYTPTDVDTVQLTSVDSDETNALERRLDGVLVAAAFNHTVVLWHHSEYSGLEFIDELINCDPSDPIKQVRFVYDAKNRLSLVVVHNNFINVWRKSTAASDSSYECVWSHGLSNVEVTIHDHPLSRSTTLKELLLTLVEADSANSATNSRNLSIKGILKISRNHGNSHRHHLSCVLL